MLMYHHLNGNSRNIVMAGATGCGKTEIWRTLSKKFNFIRIVNGPQLTCDGWKGSYHIKDIFTGETKETAECLVIVIDEADKLFEPSIGSGGTDFGQKIQNELLKIMDDDKAWDIYDQLVDNYFNMRVAIKENKPSLVAQERLAVMKDNAATRKAAMLYKIAMKTESNSSKQLLLAQAAKAITGEMIVPIMKQKEYSASDIAKKLGTTATMVGRIANKLGLKAEQPGQNKYGRWANSKSQYSNKEVAQWLYTNAGYKAIEKEVNKK